jgi:rare lipoprotein A
MLLWIALLAGCASGPRGASADRDGPEAHPPPDLIRVPDAEPRLEPIRIGGPNKPYDVLGHSYVPITQDLPFTERGLASWYGRKFQGNRTSSGEPYDMYAMTAAHPTLPIPSYARVRNPANGREVIVRINDRGPFHAGRIVDLSYTAALKLDVLRGVTPVELSRITFDEIRSGAWRQGAVPVVATNPGHPPPPSSPPMPISPPAPSVEAMREIAADVPAAAEAPPQPTALVSAAPPITDAPPARAAGEPARGFWVQLGAYRQRDGAEAFQQRVGADLDWLAPMLAVFNDASWFRLQAGPYPSRDAAQAAAERIRDRLQLVPVIVQRR